MRESDDKLAKLNMQLSEMRRRVGDAEGRNAVLEERVDWYKVEVKRLEDEVSEHGVPSLLAWIDPEGVRSVSRCLWLSHCIQPVASWIARADICRSGATG